MALWCKKHLEQVVKVNCLYVKDVMCEPASKLRPLR